MISALHLIWIVPLSVLAGVVTTALAAAAGRDSRERERRETDGG